jgi:iron complex transport system substrate-binding protein
MPLSRRQLLSQLGMGSLALAAGLPLYTRAAPLQRVVAINWAAAETLLTLGVAPLAISDVKYYNRRMPTWPVKPPVPTGNPTWSCSSSWRQN